MSAPPSPVHPGAVDPRVWRVVGTPLVPATVPEGPLSGLRVAVKDLYAVAGHRVGAGNPAWLAEAPVETEHAWAVTRLLEAGAEVTGIAQTDELAYSLAGTNAHSGTPPNPRAAGRISGGSSSGSASAVSLGQADVGLGTDTGGSIRVPAAYQGLWGLRTTHGLVPRDGLLPLAPRFDAVGWLTRDAATSAAVGAALLPTYDGPPADAVDLVVVPALLDLAEPGVRDAVAGALDRWGVASRDGTGGTGDLGDPGGTGGTGDLASLDLGAWLPAFQTWQAWEAWATHGAWLEDRLDRLGDDVRGRFERGRDLTEEQALAAREVVETAGEQVRALVGDRVLVLPSASCVAPPLGPGLTEALQRTREATMRLTCLAGLGGLPALSMPLRTGDGLPTGMCLVGGAGRDRALLALAQELAAAAPAADRI